MADVTSNLAVHLKFENNGNDSSGNGRNFTLTGTMPYVTGRIGQGCTPTSTNYWNYASPTWWNSLSAYTVAFWCKDSGYSSGEAICSWGTAAAGGSTVIYAFETDGCTIFSKGVSFPFDLTGNKPATGSWQHVCLVVESASSAKLYINGVLESTNTTNSLTTVAAQTAIRIGMYHNGGQSYSGDIDEFRMYTRALAAADVSALYGLPVAPMLANATYFARQM